MNVATLSPPRSADEGRAAARAAAPRATVMLVEDDRAFRAVLEEYLQHLGFGVVEAGSAEQAVRLLDSFQPDLIVSDVRMEGMTGIELCRRTKLQPRFALTPFILLTGLSDLEARVAGLAAGADDFFGKPCDLIELQTRIEALLRIKALQDELAARNRLLRTMFGRYVSEPVAAEIVADPERHLAPGGAKREVTVLFGDIRGFTPLAEQLDAPDVMELLNAFLGQVVDVVLQFGGTLDKFLGDGFMAVFGAPVAREDDAPRAVCCALALQERVHALRFDRFPEIHLPLGIGINTGVVVAGSIGSERRMDYTVIGNDVNLAQRLEATAGPGQILVSERTWERVRGLVDVRDLGPVALRGHSESVRVLDVLRLAAPAA
jgi:adenylate cyclase